MYKWLMVPTPTTPIPKAFSKKWTTNHAITTLCTLGYVFVCVGVCDQKLSVFVSYRLYTVTKLSGLSVACSQDLYVAKETEQVMNRVLDLSFYYHSVVPSDASKLLPHAHASCFESLTHPPICFESLTCPPLTGMIKNAGKINPNVMVVH